MKKAIKLIGVCVIVYGVYLMYNISDEESVTTFPLGIVMLGLALAGFKNNIRLTVSTILAWILVFVGVYLFLDGFDTKKHNDDSVYFFGAIVSYFIGLIILGFRVSDDDFLD